MTKHKDTSGGMINQDIYMEKNTYLPVGDDIQTNQMTDKPMQSVGLGQPCSPT